MSIIFGFLLFHWMLGAVHCTAPIPAFIGGEIPLVGNYEISVDYIPILRLCTQFQARITQFFKDEPLCHFDVLQLANEISPGSCRENGMTMWGVVCDLECLILPQHPLYRMRICVIMVKLVWWLISRFPPCHTSRPLLYLSRLKVHSFFISTWPIKAFFSKKIRT